MNRDDLVSAIIAAVNATTDEQITLVNSNLTDIVLSVELRHGNELLIDDLGDSEIASVKAECIRRYYSG